MSEKQPTSYKYKMISPEVILRLPRGEQTECWECGCPLGLHSAFGCYCPRKNGLSKFTPKGEHE